MKKREVRKVYVVELNDKPIASFMEHNMAKTWSERPGANAKVVFGAFELNVTLTPGVLGVLREGVGVYRITGEFSGYLLPMVFLTAQHSLNQAYPPSGPVPKDEIRGPQ